MPVAMLKPIACEVLARLKMSPLDPVTGNDSGALATILTNDKGKVLMISQLLADSGEERPKQGRICWLCTFSLLVTLERLHSENEHLLEAHHSLDT